MCEIEHFVKENEKDHPKFVTVKDLKIPLFPQHQQLNSGKVGHLEMPLLVIRMLRKVCVHVTAPLLLSWRCCKAWHHRK